MLLIPLTTIQSTIVFFALLDNMQIMANNFAIDVLLEQKQWKTRPPAKPVVCHAFLEHIKIWLGITAALIAPRGGTKHLNKSHSVFLVYQERMKMIPVQPNVKIAAVGNIKMHLAMTRVWIAKSAST